MDPLPTYTQINAISSRLYPASDPFVGEDESKSLGISEPGEAVNTPEPAIQPEASPKSKHTKNLTQTDLTRAPL